MNNSAYCAVQVHEVGTYPRAYEYSIKKHLAVS